MKCGEIILLEYPFTDDSGSKRRPALVVSADQFNKGEDVVIVPISSRPVEDDPHALLIRESDKYFRQTGLRRTSSVKWTKPITISERIALRRLGSLPSTPLSEVLDRLRSLFQR